MLEINKVVAPRNREPPSSETRSSQQMALKPAPALKPVPALKPAPTPCEAAGQ